HLAIIRIRARLLLRFLALTRDLYCAREHMFVHIANRNNLDRFNLDKPPQIALAVPTRADEPDAAGLVGSESGWDITRSGQSCRSSGRSFKKLTTIHGCRSKLKLNR